MGSFSDDLENELLDHVFKQAAYAAPGTMYLALGTGATDAGLSGEFAGNDYARVANGSADWAASVGGSTANVNTITFPPANGGNWGTAENFALYDKLTGGSMMAWGTCTVAKEITDGDTARYGTGLLVVTLD